MDGGLLVQEILIGCGTHRQVRPGFLQACVQALEGKGSYEQAQRRPGEVFSSSSGQQSISWSLQMGHVDSLLSHAVSFPWYPWLCQEDWRLDVALTPMLPSRAGPSFQSLISQH